MDKKEEPKHDPLTFMEWRAKQKEADGLLHHLPKYGTFDSWANRVDKEPAYDLRPGKPEVDLLSGMDKFYQYVLNRVKNARVYVNFATNASQFTADFLVIFQLGDGRSFTASYITPVLAIGMTDEQAIRHGDDAVRSLSLELGERIFSNGENPIPDGSLIIKERASL